LADGHITPIGQLDAQAGDLAAKQSVCALDGLRQSETLAGSGDRCRVPDFGFNFYNM